MVKPNYYQRRILWEMAIRINTNKINMKIVREKEVDIQHNVNIHEKKI